MEGINAKFKSYDSNKDGFLDKKEIIAYSKKDLLRQTVFLGF
jgi:Ca2+-binding EF-hand superfamily protein